MRFSVRDTGIGIEPEKHRLLFRSFSQADTSTTRQYGGTGLGLAISQRLVHMMGGKIQVTSRPGAGSRFWFELSLPTSSAVVVPPPADAARLRGARVLIVDNNPAVREALGEIAKGCGMQATAVRSGHEAIAELQLANGQTRSRPYHVVLIDWKMPAADGIETVRRIRADANLARLPTLVMVTAYDREEAVSQSRELEINGFLSKPIGSSLLAKAVLKILDRRRRPRPSSDALPRATARAPG